MDEPRMEWDVILVKGKNSFLKRCDIDGDKPPSSKLKILTPELIENKIPLDELKISWDSIEILLEDIKSIKYHEDGRDGEHLTINTNDSCYKIYAPDSFNNNSILN